MVWRCFIGDKLGPLFFIDGIVNGNTYIQILEQNHILFINFLQENGIHNVVFQQDNTSPHHTKATIWWLKTSVEQHAFTIIEIL